MFPSNLIVSHGRFQKLPNARPLNPTSGWTQMNSEIRIENSVILEYEIRMNRKIFRSTCRNVQKSRIGYRQSPKTPAQVIPLCTWGDVETVAISNICINSQLCTSTTWIKMYVNFVHLIHLLVFFSPLTRQSILRWKFLGRNDNIR